MSLQQEVLIEVTADGSSTLFVPSLDEHYHSINGAVQESKHVFIEAGLHQCKSDVVNILEIGFGTGLNAFLTLVDIQESGRKVNYWGIELYPLSLDVISNLNYSKKMSDYRKELYQDLHESEWNASVDITESFSLKKIQADFSKLDLEFSDKFDLIYFDAFAPDKQSEMWSQDIFDYLFQQTTDAGILTTYCAKGVVRRMLLQAGYDVERLSGPPGKREMLRAIKNK